MIEQKVFPLVLRIAMFDGWRFIVECYHPAWQRARLNGMKYHMNAQVSKGKFDVGTKHRVTMMLMMMMTCGDDGDW